MDIALHGVQRRHNFSSATLRNWMITALFWQCGLRTAFYPPRVESACYPRPSLLGMWSSRSAEGRKSALAHKDEAYLGWLTVKHGRRTLRWRRHCAGGVDILCKSPSCPPHDLSRLWIPRLCLSSPHKSSSAARSVFRVLQLTFQEHLHCCCFKAIPRHEPVTFLWCH